MPSKHLQSTALCAVGTALLCAGAFMRIALPVVPVTLQLELALLLGLLLGARRGALSCVVYLALGLVGLPVFAQGGGLAYVLKPSFGYILGFVPAALAAGLLTKKRTSFRRCYAACLAGTACAYIVGLAWMYGVTRFHTGSYAGFWPLLQQGFLVTIVPDILLCLGVAGAAARLLRQPFMQTLRG